MRRGSTEAPRALQVYACLYIRTFTRRCPPPSCSKNPIHKMRENGAEHLQPDAAVEDKTAEASCMTRNNVSCQYTASKTTQCSISVLFAFIRHHGTLAFVMSKT